jgi:hypothetical protein
MLTQQEAGMAEKTTAVTAWENWERFGRFFFELLHRVLLLGAVVAAAEVSKLAILWFVYAVGAFALISATNASVGLYMIHEGNIDDVKVPRRLAPVLNMAFMLALTALISFGIPALVERVAHSVRE